MSSVSIAHITDLHISADLSPVQGVDVASNFLSILEDVKKDSSINKIVIGGDLCFKHNDIAALIWIKEQLDATGIPYHVIPGNHDDNSSIAEVFSLTGELEEGRLFFWEELDFGKIFFLDTGAGDLPMHQLAWVEEECAKSYQKFLLFMHHPPAIAGVPFMDKKHGLKNMDVVQKVLRNINNIQGIFCGHFHVERSIRMYNHIVFVTPSTFFQIDDNSDDFAISSYDIAWRKIKWDGTHLLTSVKYIRKDLP